MLFLPILKHSDHRLSFMANVMVAGILLLLGGLWVVQVAFGSHFEHNSRVQSVKRVGIPAIRGKILDCNGRVLADSRAKYNAILYLEDLQNSFIDTFKLYTKAYGVEHPELVNKKGRVNLTPKEARGLQLRADCAVVSNITYQVGTALDDPRILNTNAFLRHYESYPYVPFEIVPDLGPRQIARFAEQLSSQPELEIETEPLRSYPGGELAAHVLGFVRREAVENEETSYALPDYDGKSGIERLYDSRLKGKPGVKLVLVNSLNYRQREDIETPNEVGDDIYLTIDLNLQKTAEKELAEAPGMTHVRGAVVVMDVRNGDILAMASAPAFDPNDYVTGLSKDTLEELNDPKYTPQLDRAVSGAYPPGSGFKIITALACLETPGFDPNAFIDSPGYFQASPRARPIRDTAGPGKFDLRRAFYRSSNTYFITNGWKLAGQARILEMAKRFHLGEKTHFPFGPEVSGNVPPPEKAFIALKDSSTPDLCIGQEITVTPLQMACMISAVANGGKIFWPRIVSHAAFPGSRQEEQLFEQGRLRDTVKVDPRHLDLIRAAMLDDTEHGPDTNGLGGTAYEKFHSKGKPLLPNFRVAGKTGTAEVKSHSPNSPHHITWFYSYGPFENPRYAVIVMVEDGSFGGPTCAPVAEKIYEALIKREQSMPMVKTLARN